MKHTEQPRNRKRNIQLHFMLNQTERDLIRQKMALLGTNNMGAYLREMAIDGCVINLDLSDVKALVSLLRRCSNNLNQYTKWAQETGSIYAADIEDLSHMLDGIWSEAKKILATLAKL